MREPRLLEIKFTTFRHWKATIEYLLYTQLVNLKEDEYVCDQDDLKFFRKRK